MPHADSRRQDATCRSSLDLSRCANQPLIILKPSLTQWENLPPKSNVAVKPGFSMMQAINRRDLEAQTFGDRALALEILVLFTQQAPALLRAIAATAGAARGEIAHRLKGSALAIGAGMLAAAAAELEEAPDDPECVAKVERTLRDVESDIAAIRSE